MITDKITLLMRRVVGTRALNAGNADQLAELLQAVFDAIVASPLS